MGTIVAERYQILEVLGEGSMGTVYAAEHLLLKKKMAVKVLHSELTAVKSLAIRFEREAMATAKLDHPNVAAATDFGRVADGTMYLALEFVEGRSLRDEIKRGAFPVMRALHVARQIASLLAAAQGLGIVHRDLKPENVMLVQRGDDPDFVKVLDFGIARITGEIEGESSPAEALTKIGAVFGTPEYMAPEQALGQRVDTRADLYSLGVILFEMIAGTRPYSGVVGQSGILAQQITAPRPSFADVAPNAEVPETVERVVNRLLAKGVGERFQRASDVVQILEQLAQGGDVTGIGGSLVPSKAEALPAFALTTHVTGLASADSSSAVPGDRSSPQASTTKTAAARWVQRIRDGMVRVETTSRAMLQRGQQVWRRRAAPMLAGIPPLVIAAFLAGLSIGLAVAVMVWIFATIARGSAADTARLAAASSSVLASSSASAAGPIAEAEASSAPTPSAVLDTTKDPDFMLDSAQAKAQESRDSDAVALVVKVLSKHPDRRGDPRVAEVLYRAANSTSKDASDTAFALLEGTMATKGSDILYQLWLDRAVRDATKRRAEKWLRSDQFARSAPNATVVAVRLRLAESCERKHDLLPTAAKGGTQFALAYLHELENDKGCGINGASDCFPCLRKDGQLRQALDQIEARLAK